MYTALAAIFFIVCIALLAQDDVLRDDVHRFRHFKKIQVSFSDPGYVAPVRYGPFLSQMVLLYCESFGLTCERAALLYMRVASMILYITSILLAAYFTRYTGSKGMIGPLLTAAMLIGLIRYAGNAALNVKDGPAASTLLICSLLTWKLFNGTLKNKPVGQSIAIAFLSTIPFLTRPPLIQLMLLSGALLLWECFASFGKRTFKTSIMKLCTFCIATIGILTFMYPAFVNDVKQHGLKTGVTMPVEYFDNFYKYARWAKHKDIHDFNTFETQFREWENTGEPVTVIMVIWGLLLSVYVYVTGKNISMDQSDTLDLKKSLPVWLWSIVTGSVIAIYLLNPDTAEHRHLLFLYPLMATLGAYGLQILPRSIKSVICILIICSSLYAYSQWGFYSYAYRSAMSPKPTRDNLLLCIPQLIRNNHDMINATIATDITASVSVINEASVKYRVDDSVAIIRIANVTELMDIEPPFSYFHESLDDIDIKFINENFSWKPVDTVAFPDGTAACSLMTIDDYKASVSR